MKLIQSTILSALLLVGSASADNLLLDPSFDASAPASQTNPNWTLDVNCPDGVGSAAQFQDAGWASNPVGTPGVGVWSKPFEGMQAAGDPPANATLWQDVSGPAGEYDVSFFYRKEANYTSESTLVELLEDGTRIGHYDLTNIDPTDGFEEFSFSGTSAGGTLRVQASMLNGTVALANPQSSMFDDFSLIVVPEPSGITILMLGLLSILGRRRRLV